MTSACGAASPLLPCKSLYCENTTMMPNSCDKQVTFGKTMEHTAAVDVSTLTAEERASLWYSKEDQTDFYIQARLLVKKKRHHYADGRSSPPINQQLEEVDSKRGLERFMSKRRSHVMKRNIQAMIQLYKEVSNTPAHGNNNDEDAASRALCSLGASLNRDAVHRAIMHAVRDRAEAHQIYQDEFDKSDSSIWKSYLPTNGRAAAAANKKTFDRPPVAPEQRKLAAARCA